MSDYHALLVAELERPRVKSEVKAAADPTFKTFKRASEGFESASPDPFSDWVPTSVPDRNSSGLPDEYALPMANLSNSHAPGDYEPDKWRDALAGMEAFCAQWAGRARALGWEGEELFSLHPTAPAARHDKRGLALSLGGGARVESIDSEGADIRTPGGSRLRFYRKAGQ
jgi:hypothetical protein